MFLRRLRPVVLTVAMFGVSNAGAFEKIECRDTPAAVRAAAAKQKTKPGSEASCEKIDDNGKTFYEFKVIAESGKMLEMVYRPNGQIAEFEEESQLSEIPPAARAAIEKAVAAGQLLKVDIIHRDRALLYEGEYRIEGAKKKVIVDAVGRAIAK